MASFRKTPQGSYQATIYVGRDGDKILREYLTRPTLKECKAAAREREQEIEDGNYTSVGNAKVITLIKEYIDLNRGRLAPSTVATYLLYLRAHYEPYFKNKKARDLQEIDIRKFMAHQLEALSVTTVRKHVSVLNKILEERMKNRNPGRFVKLPKKTRYVPRIPTDDEFLAIHEVFRGIGLREEIIVLLAGWCSLRRGEIFALKPDDVFKKRQMIRINECYAIDEFYDYNDKDPKSANGFREVAVPKYLMDRLQEYMKSLGEIPDRLFPFRPDHWSTRFHEIIVAHGLAPVRFHDLRHYHATWLWKNGIPDHKAAERLGDDIQTLKQVYQHLGLKESENMDDEIRQMLEEPPKKFRKFKLKRTSS